MARSTRLHECPSCGRTTISRLAKGLCPTCYAHMAQDPNPVDQNGLAWTTTRPTLTTTGPTDWQDHAACAHLGPDLFFPELGDSAAEAKAVCAGCPVADRCLDYAMANRIKHGIWGGLSEKERRRQRGRIHRGEAA